MSASLPLRFVTSADTVDRLPAARVEVAVAGRSNVGKSSLLNALAGQAGLAKTSGTPGRTRLLNCFALDATRTVVDLPGYGYAKTSKADRTAWQRRTQEYLLTRGPLVQVLLLVDGEIGPTRLDLDEMAWLRTHDVPFTVVATKHDKVRSSRRERRKREVAEACELPRGEIVWVSAHTGVNIPHLRTLVRGWLQA